MTPEEKAEYRKMVIYNIEQYLNRLPMVRWDRYTVGTDGIDTGGIKIKRFDVYGWIDREGDADRKDFVVMTFAFNHTENQHTYSFMTSSAKHTKEISKALGMDVRDHRDCIRVEETFPNVKNAIHLKKEPKQ